MKGVFLQNVLECPILGGALKALKIVCALKITCGCLEIYKPL